GGEVVPARLLAGRPTDGVHRGDAHGLEAREALALGCPGPVLLQHIPQDLGDLGGLADLPAVGAADLMAVRSGDDDGADVLTPHAGEEDGVPGLRDGLGPVRTLVLPDRKSVA